MKRIYIREPNLNDIDDEISRFREEAMSLPIGYRFNLFLKIVDLLKIKNQLNKGENKCAIM